MNRFFCFFLCLLTTFSLRAATPDEILSLFPTSHSPWKLFFDADLVVDLEFDMDDDDDFFFEGEFEDDEDDQDNPLKTLQIYVHREKDALEHFLIMELSFDNQTDFQEEFFDYQFAKSLLKNTLKQLFPNCSIQDNCLPDSSVVEWTFALDNQELSHGYSLDIKKEEDGSYIHQILLYSTTALKTEESKKIWTDVLQSLENQS